MQRFGPYELVRPLGSGGMAETHLAVRRGPAGFEQHVCVKRILPVHERDPELVRQFMEEARLAAQLRHSNITQVVDFGVVEGSHYLALELVDGMDLRSLLKHLRERGARLDPSVVAYVGTELAKALDFAHTPSGSRYAVVHRDISPSNILASRAGEVYLTDFGIARALGVKRQTESGVIRGKVPYMAPEYALGGRFDARSDLFALGVVLFEMLAGHRPFDGATDLDTLQRIKDGNRKALGPLRPDAPPQLVKTIERMLAPDPSYRWQSAAEVLDALSAVAAPATTGRVLGELVRGAGGSLAASLRVSSPSQTAGRGGAPPPSYPAVQPAGPHDPTRTSEPPHAKTVIDPSAAALAETLTGPGQGWSATDPSYISHHGNVALPAPSRPPSPGPQPVAQTAQPIAQPIAHAPIAPPIAQPIVHAPIAPPVPQAKVSTPPSRPIPPTAVHVSTPPSQPAVSPGGGAGRTVVLVLFGLIAFAAASAGGYFLVEAVRSGAIPLP